MPNLPIFNACFLGLGILLISASILKPIRGAGFPIFQLFMGALSLRLGGGLLEDFINIWDEQFHALVAKHLAETPLTPRLYPEEVLPYSVESWTNNYIWLHKQPLFLWQMALSIKVFGNTVLGVRLPSILMSASMVYLIFGIGRRIFSKDAAFWGAFLFSVCYFPIQLNTGSIPTDHNDVAFVFYVACSILAWLKYVEKPTLQRAIVVGLLAGAAILTKWLVGLSVYLIWGVWAIVSKNITRSQIVNGLISLVAACAVFVPWNLYIFSVFPQEAAHEMTYNSKHLWEALEGHSEPWYFHFSSAVKMYGVFGIVLFFLGDFKGLWSTIKARALIGWMFFVFGLFTFAATKMLAFTYVLSPVIFLIMGSGLKRVFTLNQKDRRWLVTAACLLIIVTYPNFLKLINSHGVDNEFRRVRYEVAEFAKDLHKNENDQGILVFNLPYQTHPILMFFSDAIGYDRALQEEQLLWLESKGFQIIDYKKYPSKE